MVTRGAGARSAMADAGGAAMPVSPAEFDRLMLPFAPFEPAPHLALAVSGGPDSMALALLADGWARTRGGTVTALVVDHRLRPESAEEAAQVGRWLAARGIAHHCLVRQGPVPAGDRQAAARAARYRLLEGWCERHGVLHLLTGHQREDQAETVLLRLARGSGLDGLAAMPAVSERYAYRVLRPFLAVPREGLKAFLAAAGQPFIEDPSNADPAFARARLRALRVPLAAAGLGTERLAGAAAQLGRARAALEAGVAALAARAVLLHPLGFARLDGAALKAAPEELGLRLLATLLATLSGSDYPPRLARIERLYRALPDRLQRGRTLGGCLIIPRRGGIVLCREPAAVAAPVAAAPGETTRWDGRFAVTLPAAAPPGLMLGALGPDAVAGEGIPAAVCRTLPALRDARGLWVAPGLPYRQVFRPTRPLVRPGFTVV
jgi:tRNA(Ile)-lysidine synthase